MCGCTDVAADGRRRARTARRAQRSAICIRQPRRIHRCSSRPNHCILSNTLPVLAINNPTAPQHPPLPLIGVQQLGQAPPAASDVQRATRDIAPDFFEHLPRTSAAGTGAMGPSWGAWNLRSGDDICTAHSVGGHFGPARYKCLDELTGRLTCVNHKKPPVDGVVLL